MVNATVERKYEDGKCAGYVVRVGSVVMEFKRLRDLMKAWDRLESEGYRVVWAA